jgi:hypothetical protein
MSDASPLYHFEVWFTDQDEDLVPESVQAAANACWENREDRSLLVMDGRDMVVQGALTAATPESVFSEAIEAANDYYLRAVGWEPTWSRVSVRTVGEQLAFIASGLPHNRELPMPHDSVAILRRSANVIAHAANTEDAWLCLPSGTAAPAGSR